MPRGSFSIQRLQESIEKGDTALGTRVADSTRNRIEVSSAYNFNVGRHRFIEDLNTGGGTYVFDETTTDRLDDQEGKMVVTASAGEEHLFGAREVIRYVPNYELLWGVSAWAEDTLTDGQHYALEYMNTNASEGYRYHFEGTPDGPTLTLEQVRSDTIVDSTVVDLETLEDSEQFDHAAPYVARAFMNWYGAGLTRYTLSYPRVNNDDEVVTQTNPTVGHTADRTDIATNESNLRINVRTWVETGGDDLLVNIGSIGSTIQGNAAQFNREKPAMFWDVGEGDIGMYPSDNATSAIAGRIDPTRKEVAIQMLPPLFQPTGTSVRMELTVYAVHNSHPDLTVNFDDPGDDGVDEGPSPSAQSKAQTDVMQYTRDVTSIPTTTDIRADGTTGLVPDMRHVTTTFGQSGGGGNPGTTSGGELSSLKRNIYPEDVVIFLPRTDPAGQTTSGNIRYMKILTEQDW